MNKSSLQEQNETESIIRVFYIWHVWENPKEANVKEFNLQLYQLSNFLTVYF